MSNIRTEMVPFRGMFEPDELTLVESARNLTALLRQWAVEWHGNEQLSAGKRSSLETLATAVDDTVDEIVRHYEQAS